MRRLILSTSTSLLYILASCGDNPTAAPTGFEPANAALTDVIDAENFGDARDIRVRVDRPADAEGIAQFRVFVSRAAGTGIDAAIAAALSPDRYMVVPVAGSQDEYSPDASLLDTDGEPIVEHVSYRVNILTVPVSGDVPANALSAAPATIILRRTHLVRTITDVIQAGSGGMDVDAQGRIYHADFGATLNGPPGTRIHRISPDGSVSVWIDGLVGASGNAFDAAGNLFQSNINAGRISRITPAGVISTYATNGLAAPVGIAIDADNHLFVANCGDNTIRRVLPDGSTQRFAESPLLACPNGITLAPDGNLYVANFSNGDVLRVTPDGEVTRLVTLAGGNNGHILFGNGVLYVVARAAHRLYEVTLDGQVTILAGTGTRGRRDGAARDATLSLPNDVALSPDGTVLYFNDVAGHGTEWSVTSPVVVRALVLVDGAQQ